MDIIMCTVSMISGHYYDRFPEYTTFPPAIYPDYQELLRKAQLYDGLTGQKDCSDPTKAEWEKRLEKFMQEKYGLNPSA